MHKRKTQKQSKNGLGIFILSISMFASAESLVHFNIPRQDADEALLQFGEQADISVVYEHKLVKTCQANPLQGLYTMTEGVRVMLDGSGLKAEFRSGSHLVIIRNDEGMKGMNTKKKLLASVVSFFVGGSGSVAFAQEVADLKEGSGWMLEEIIVTAQKREQNLIDVPISIVALGAVELEARGISNFEDLGMAVPGLTVQDNGGTNRRVFMRGLGNAAGATSSLIGLYLDDMSVSGNPAFTLDLRPYDMERIEVLRGPQGTLYGDGSVGGTIRFITKKPQLDIFSGTADITASFTEGGDPSQKVQGAINVPLINDELGLRIVGTYENAGGWIDQLAESNDNYNDQEVFNIRTNLLWHATDALEVSAMAIVHRNDSSLNVTEDEDGNFTQVLGLTTTPSFDDAYELYNVSLTYDAGSFEITSSTGYLDSSTETNELGNTFLEFNELLSDFTVDSSIFNQELRISSVSDGGWNWTLGAFYKDRKIDQLVATYLFGTPSEVTFGPVPFSPDDQNSQSWAVFGDTSYAVTERLEIGVGLRYFEDDRDFSDGTTTQTGTFDSLSPRLYANFDLTDDIKTYASIAKGFRSGGFNPVGQPEFDPETIWSYELGTKMSLLNGRLNAELAVFYSDYTDFQTVGLVEGSPSAITSNGGDAEIKGLDASITWQATEGLVLALSGNYVDSEVTALNVTSASHIVGDSLDYVSKYSATFSATQDFEWSGRLGSVRLDYNYQDKMLLTNRRFGLFGSSDIINMLNLNIEWALSEAVSIGIFGSNLLNERGYLDPLTAFGIASRPRPRTFGLQLGLDF